MKRIITTIALLCLTGSLAQAQTLNPEGSESSETITCNGEVDMYGEIQKFTVTVVGQGIGQGYTESSVQKITVRGASLEKPVEHSHAADYWDGHSSGMITAKGFSMKYDNVYGCMRNVTVTTDFRGIAESGQTVGHIATSKVIALCKNATPSCSR